MKKELHKLTHVDNHGAVWMVDVSDKIPQKRYAMAQGKILLNAATLQLIKKNQIKKGDVLSVARIAGIQAAKCTAQLIPLCHPLILNKVEIELKTERDGVVATTKVHCIGRTGVEMEALTAVNIALLTIYDMCKAVDKNMIITNINLLAKVKSDVA